MFLGLAIRYEPILLFPIDASLTSTRMATDLNLAARSPIFGLPENMVRPLPLNIWHWLKDLRLYCYDQDRR
jgi:hypothetical protein